MSAINRLYPDVVGGANLFALDRGLHALLARRAPAMLAQERAALTTFGAWVGRDAEEEAAYTDRFARPVLEAYDRNGTRVNHIRYNDKWLSTAQAVYRFGLVGRNYGAAPAPFLLTFTMGYLLSQANVSLHCPVTMTAAVAFVIDRFASPDIRARYLPALTAMDGTALTAGTWATEHHGGSDIGATTTRAVAHGDHVGLHGLKWFASNADSDLALATARPEGAPQGSKGLGVYLVPRAHPDGTANAFCIRRLKDKLGTCGVATGEIDLEGAFALEVAPPPRGFKLMMDALGFSRIHNAFAAAGVARRALLEATGYAHRRHAFGAPITRYPMVQDELLALLVAAEADLALAVEAAMAFDRAGGQDVEAETPERAWLRFATALAKYMTAEDANMAARRALEVIGGNGYTEGYVTARLLRDAQALSVWEGPANIQALELLRLLGGDGEAQFCARVRGIIAATPEGLGRLAQSLAKALDEVETALAWLARAPEQAERHARRLIGWLSDILAAALLIEAAGVDAAKGDLRAGLIALLFIEQRLAPPENRGIAWDRAWTSAVFEPLLAFAPVEAAPIALAQCQ